MEGFILVVDDTPFYGKLIVSLLSSKTSYQIQLVEMGHDALNAATGIIPLLFLLDYRLPDMTGIELYDQLHKREGREMVPAIMVSADLSD
jgi:CheY-like chemotaxis protein